MRQRVRAAGKAWALMATILPALACSPARADDAGRNLFEPCRACHALDPAMQGMAGPNLSGLLGRRVAGDPRFDYRLLIVGSVLPGLIDLASGGARALHSLAVSVVVLAVVMVATPRGSSLRRTLMGLPIGMLLHLVFTGAWLDADVFWWPFTGSSFEDAPHPIVERGWWNVVLELIGLGLCWWVVVRAELRTPGRWAMFRHTGQLTLPVRPRA